MPTTRSLKVMPLTADRFDDLVPLFNEGGDPKWCWCVYWRVRAKDFAGSAPSRNRERLRELAGHRDPPGLVAYAGDRLVGWVSLGPRGDFERLEHSKVRPRLDDVPVWSIVCFVVSKHARGQGIARALLDAAIEHARQAGAPALEA
ncbi:MAG TPA: GNAT family N-acetyltransferase, partial [Candidatus Limnocylindrales bacterium]